MTMKKNMDSDNMYIIKESNDNDIFPVGFEYLSGGLVYRVQSDITKESSSPMRRIVSSNGDVEDVTIATIKKDLQEHDAKVISTGIEKKEEKKNDE